MLVSAASAGVRFVAPLVPGPLRQLGGSIAGAFGFDMPRSISAGSGVYLTGLKDFPAGSGVSHATMLSRFPDSRSATVFTGAEAGDEMELARMAARPGYVGSFSITSSSVPDTTVFSLPVNPKYCPSATTTWVGQPVVYPTPAAVASQPFGRWRGVMRYGITWSCSGFHNARLRAYFVPGREDDYIAPVAPALSAANALIEVAGPGGVELDLPFVSPFPYAAQSIGRFCVQVVTPPSEIGDVAGVPIYFTVVASLVDAEFVDFDNTLLLPVTAATGLGPRVDIEAQGRLEGAPIPLGERAHVHVGGGAYTGEVFTHLSQLLHAPQYHALAGNPSGVWRDLPMVDAAPISVVSGGVNVWYTPTDVASGLPTTSVALTSGVSCTDTEVSAQIGVSLFRHFANAFMFWCGGMRLHIAYVSGGGTQPATRAWPVPYPTYVVGIDGAGTHGTRTVARPGGAVHEECSTSDLVQLEAPYVAGVAFAPTSVGNPTAWAGAVPFSCARARTAFASALCVDTQRATGARVYASAADDFRYSFAGAPSPAIVVRGGAGDGAAYGPWAAFAGATINWHANPAM